VIVCPFLLATILHRAEFDALSYEDLFNNASHRCGDMVGCSDSLQGLYPTSEKHVSQLTPAPEMLCCRSGFRGNDGDISVRKYLKLLYPKKNMFVGMNLHTWGQLRIN